LALAPLPPTDMPLATPVPPHIYGSYVILIGSYDNAREAQAAETMLRDRQLTSYAVDVAMAPDDVQRRILIGRFATRVEAEAALEKLGPPFTAASRVIRGSQERVPALVP
jgi:cell division septation protein DedD